MARKRVLVTCALVSEESPSLGGENLIGGPLAESRHSAALRTEFVDELAAAAVPIRCLDRRVDALGSARPGVSLADWHLSLSQEHGLVLRGRNCS